MDINDFRLRLFDVVLQVATVWVCAQISYQFNLNHNVIPDFIFHVPAFYTSVSDLQAIAMTYVIVFALFSSASQYFNGPGVFSCPKRFALEYLIYLTAYTTASIYSFIATNNNYDPQLFAAIGVFSTLAYVLLFLIYSGFQQGLALLPAHAIQAFIQTLKRCFSLKGVIVVAYFIFPLVLAKAYVSNRDVANLITQVRIYFNPVTETEWGLNNIYPSMPLAQPMLVKQAPNDSDSLYILERSGRILNVGYPNGDAFELLLNFESLMGEVEIENGALGFDFHPQFGVNGSRAKGYIYLYFTDTRAEQQVNRLSRFDLSLGTLDERLLSELPLLALERNNEGWHNGGSVEFGPDGFLYVGIGEGVHPLGITDSSKLLRAGMLRLDVDTENTAQSQAPSLPLIFGRADNYLVPKDNPYIGNPNIMDEYWALGLRNPFRFNFDPSTNQLWLGDVGTTVWEEVNIIEPGKHYQFPFIEGYEETGIPRPPTVFGEEQPPVFTYEHNAYDRAVIGGVLYRGDVFPELTGKYIFADNYSAKVFLLNPDDSPVTEVELIARGAQFAQRGISSVTQLASGEILFTALGAASENSGEILTLVPADQVIENTSAVPTQPTNTVYDREITRGSYDINCARCHGFEGDGQSPDSLALGVPLPDFTSTAYQQSKSDSEIYDVIFEGGQARGLSPLMPPWGEFLGEVEVTHMVNFVRDFESQ